MKIQLPQRHWTKVQQLTSKVIFRPSIGNRVGAEPRTSNGYWPLATYLPSSGADLEHVRQPVDVEETFVLHTETKAPEIREESQELER